MNKLNEVRATLEVRVRNYEERKEKERRNLLRINFARCSKISVTGQRGFEVKAAC